MRFGNEIFSIKSEVPDTLAVLWSEVPVKYSTVQCTYIAGIQKLVQKAEMRSFASKSASRQQNVHQKWVDSLNFKSANSVLHQELYLPVLIDLNCYRQYKLGKEIGIFA